MEYSSLQSSTLGGFQLQGALASSLNSKKYDVEKKKTDVVFEPDGHFFKPLAVNSDFGFFDTSNNGKTQEDESTEDESKEDESKEDESKEDESKEETNRRFQFAKSPINTFFIGSITVVGLFVLYRLLQKNR